MDQEQNTGVEETEVANPQTNEQVESPVNDIPDTGVEHSPDAEVKDEKDFSKALNARSEQIRQKLEDEYKAKYADHDNYKQAHDVALRTAKYYGFGTVQEYQQALDQAEQERRIAEQASSLGVDEEVIRNHLQPLNEKVSTYEKELTELKHAESLRQVEFKINAMEQDAVNFPDFAKHKDSIIGIAAERGYTLEDAYKIFTFDDRINSVKAQAEQEAIRKLQQNADSSPGALGADAPEQAGDYTAMSASERKAFRERVKAGQVNF